MKLQSKRLTADFEHCRTTNWTFTLHCWLTIFHGYLLGIRVITLSAALNTIHCSHISFNSPPSGSEDLEVYPSIALRMTLSLSNGSSFTLRLFSLS